MNAQDDVKREKRLNGTEKGQKTNVNDKFNSIKVLRKERFTISNRDSNCFLDFESFLSISRLIQITILPLKCLQILYFYVNHFSVDGRLYEFRFSEELTI